MDRMKVREREKDTEDEEIETKKYRQRECQNRKQKKEKSIRMYAQYVLPIFEMEVWGGGGGEGGLVRPLAK